MGEHAALVTLLRARPQGLSWPALTERVREAGSAVAVVDELLVGDLLTDPDARFAGAEAELAAWQGGGVRFVSVLDPDYPAQLRDIHQAPPFLFARGHLLRRDVAVSVVGSRKASERGVQLATNIAGALAREGHTVSSGLAAGIDAAAHRAALRAGGRTVALLGTGIERTYPATHRGLAEEIVASGGLLLSQFWPAAPPQPHTFPMRNATMSGYSVATVVVEAGEHSGTRIQARMAVEHGRPVILTDLVLARTQWGKDLQGRPGVHVVSGLDQVVEVVRGLRAADEELDQLLTAV